MFNSWSSVLVTVGLFVTLCNSLLIDSIANTWENTHYLRTVDLASSFVKENDLIEIKNIGELPQDTYYYTLNDGFDSIDGLSIVSVTLVDQKVQIVPVEIEPKLFKLTFPAPIAPNSKVELKVIYVYIEGLTPLPAKLDMAQTQSLLIKLNKFPYSPYKTSEYSLHFTGITKGQEMELFLSKDVIVSENVPDLRPRVENKSLVYGPIMEDIEPFTLQPMGLMYEHNRPLTRVENLNRSIWITASDVDQLPIEEYYELTNNAAELSKGFSRVDWMTGRYEAERNHWALSHLEFQTTDTTKFDDYYYSDLVGVVSTHKLIQSHLLLQPRFPIFGNWHYNFTLGWNNKLSSAVRKFHNSDDTYIVKVPIINTLADASYNNTYLNFYLPENSEFVNVSSPVEFESITVGNELSYFDVSKGHVKVTIHYKNLFSDISRLDALVVYKYSKVSYFLKIAKISGFVFVGLISYYLLSLIDLSISKN